MALTSALLLLLSCCPPSSATQNASLLSSLGGFAFGAVGGAVGGAVAGNASLLSSVGAYALGAVGGASWAAETSLVAGSKTVGLRDSEISLLRNATLQAGSDVLTCSADASCLSCYGMASAGPAGRKWRQSSTGSFQ